MMNTRQQLHIKEFIKFLSTNSGGESVISFVANNNGMLGACEELQKDIARESTGNLDWVKKECAQVSITFQYFLKHFAELAALFTAPLSSSEYLDILGLPLDASRNEIKQRYRKLSLRYHPDTARDDEQDSSEKFMEITKAYHVLMDEDREGDLELTSVASNQKNWQPITEQRLKPKRSKHIVLWLAALVAGLVVFSIIASNIYQKQAMLSGLKESNSALVPSPTPVKEVAEEVEGQDVARNLPTIIEGNTQGDSTKSVGEKELPNTEQTNLNVDHRPTEKLDHNEKSAETHLVEVENKPDLSELKEDNLDTISSTSNSTPSKPQSAEGKKLTFIDKDKGIKKRVLNTSESPVTVIDDESILPSVRSEEQKPVSQLVVVQKSKAINPDGSKSDKVLNDDLTINRGVEVVEASQNEQITLDKEAPNVDQQLKIEAFFDEYIEAYEQRNAILYARFFSSDALENGKSFTSMLPVYVDLFSATSQVEMALTMLGWEAVDDGILVRNRFKVYLLYNDSSEVRGTGAIRFVLKDSDGEFRISAMDYEFDN